MTDGRSGAVRDRVRLGMVGGGEGAFIGAVHRAAAALDGMFDLRAGALSSDAARARRSGVALGLPPERCYGNWREMLDAERRLPDPERIEAVAIVTPNATHHEIAKAFVEAGFHVVIDKPMTTTAAQARDLVGAVERAGVVFAVTYTYSGYPMVRHARELVRAGALGAVRRVCVEYHQGWLATNIEAASQKQALWRTDPAIAGPGGAIGDIGTHAAHLLRFVTGLEIEALCADLSAFVPGRRVDDDAAAILTLTGGARATLSASQVCVGEANNLSIRVHGESGSLYWRHDAPDALELRSLDGEQRTLTRGMAGLSAAASNATRLPPGHPEGFIEALANIYKDAAGAMAAWRSTRRAPAHGESPYPTVLDGLHGALFVERMIRSANARGWTPWNP